MIIRKPLLILGMLIIFVSMANALFVLDASKSTNLNDVVVAQNGSFVRAPQCHLFAWFSNSTNFKNNVKMDSSINSAMINYSFPKALPANLHGFFNCTSSLDKGSESFIIIYTTTTTVSSSSSRSSSGGEQVQSGYSTGYVCTKSYNFILNYTVANGKLDNKADINILQNDIYKDLKILVSKEILSSHVFFFSDLCSDFIRTSNVTWPINLSKGTQSLTVDAPELPEFDGDEIKKDIEEDTTRFYKWYFRLPNFDIGYTGQTAINTLNWFFQLEYSDQEANPNVVIVGLRVIWLLLALGAISLIIYIRTSNALWVKKLKKRLSG